MAALCSPGCSSGTAGYSGALYGPRRCRALKPGWSIFRLRLQRPSGAPPVRLLRWTSSLVPLPTATILLCSLSHLLQVRQSNSGELLLQGGFMFWTTKNPSGLGLEGFGAGRRRGSDGITRCGRPSEPTPQARAYLPYSLGISIYSLDARIAPPDGGRY